MVSRITREADLGLAHGWSWRIFIERLRRALSDAKASGNLTTWLAILLSFGALFGTVLIKAGQIIDRQDTNYSSLKELYSEKERRHDARVEDLQKRLDEEKEERKALKLEQKKLWDLYLVKFGLPDEPRVEKRKGE